MAGTGNGAVQIDVIGGERMARMASMEKVRMILDGVREGNVVVLEAGLSPAEESRLVEVTMAEVVPGEFSGIEIETHPSPGSSGGVLDRFRGNDGPRLTVVGPADRIETLDTDETGISAVVSGD